MCSGFWDQCKAVLYPSITSLLLTKFTLYTLLNSNVSLFLPTEGRPDRTGLRMSNKLAALGIPVKVLIDSAVAYSMDEVDMVFVGADAVVESGGIINMMGTYQIALVAHNMNKPVYVAAESYKVLYALITHGNDTILLMLLMSSLATFQK
jgi:translation initiation factor 2B subunit (eIF-2B alpha/beta/delta family)